MKFGQNCEITPITPITSITSITPITPITPITLITPITSRIFFFNLKHVITPSRDSNFFSEGQIQSRITRDHRVTKKADLSICRAISINNGQHLPCPGENLVKTISKHSVLPNFVTLSSQEFSPNLVIPKKIHQI